MNSQNTIHKDRVNKAISFEKPDKTPRDFAASPEIWDKLNEHFGTDDRNEILKNLDVDCRVVAGDSFCEHPAPRSGNIKDGITIDLWGARRKKVKNPVGELEQFTSFALESAESVDDLKNYNWPQPDWWNFTELRSVINSINKTEVYNIRYRIGGFFETAWSIYNFEKFLLESEMYS